MRAKAPDGAGRVRPVTIGFRVTREQNAEIDELVAITGMTKQDYIVSRLMDRSIVVTPNARVQQALARHMDRIYAELRRIERAGDMPDDLKASVVTIAEAFAALGHEPADDDGEDGRATILEMERS
jgi:hypothetical protein